jgi:hypothetical protein
MKSLILAAAVLSVSAITVANAAPSRQAKCWVMTDASRGYGYSTTCGGLVVQEQSRAQPGRPTLTPVRTPIAVVAADPTAGDGGGGGGGDGGGGGGGR